MSPTPFFRTLREGSRSSAGMILVSIVGMLLAFALGRASAVDVTPIAETVSLPSFLAKNPPDKDAPNQIIPLLQGKDLSVSVVRAQKELKPHYHQDREEVVYFVRGGGTQRLGDKLRSVKAGDVIFIPRGVVHGFVNGSKGESIIVSVMSPPFDGKDRHFLTDEEDKALPLNLDTSPADTPPPSH